MGDRDHRAVFGDSFQGIEDFFLGLGIQVGCDLVEEKKVRFCGCGSRDGEELPLTGRKAPACRLYRNLFPDS